MSDPLDPNASERARLLAAQHQLRQTIDARLERYRATAQSKPEAFLMNTYLTEDLLYYCRKSIELDCPEEVPRLTKELAAVEGALARRYPDYCWCFTGRLDGLSDMLREKARPEEALKVMEDALELARTRAQSNPAAGHFGFTHRLARRASSLSASGRSEEALKVMEEAIEFYRALTRNSSPGEFNQGLAPCLAQLGTILLELDRPRDALKVTEEAVELYRTLVRKLRPFEFNQGLAPYLAQLGTILLKLDRPRDALKAMIEDVDFHAYCLPEQFISSLETLGGILGEKGYPEEAELAANAVLRQRERLRLADMAQEQEQAARRAGAPQWVV